MAYFTKSEARTAAARSRGLQKSFGSNPGRVLKESVTAATAADRFDVFLSHSIADAEIVLGIKQLLEENGLKVYVDWVEDALLDRRAVTKETAAVLRQRMRQSKSLIYLSSGNSSSSKWMPWELGYFDGFMPDGVPIMPVLDSQTDTFKGQEYIGLYPIVQKDTYKDGRPDIFVEELGVRWSTLKKFGSGQPAWAMYG
ncbi:toll/interleukin-1 receptor domain-containing protein [Acidovorax sp. DW039]|uniref:TIR domain-containing protein n=1 Tax=Acidovorax sp. DW039 TaxID=3095606 RepID=UPI00308D3EE3|nr:toll/interleukin-1 receptor domain-containing protein [Acidovorax sp. DW039]